MPSRDFELAGEGPESETGDVRRKLQDHLGVQLDRIGVATVTGRMPIGPHARTGNGSFSIGAVGALVDQVAGSMSGETQRAPTVTSQISVRLPPPASASALVAAPRVLRRGRATVVLMVDIFDEDTGESAGGAMFTGATLQGAGGSHEPSHDLGRHFIWQRRPAAAGAVATDQYLDMHTVAQDGSTHGARLDLHEWLRNVANVLHGGAAMLITEEAARLAAQAHGVSCPVVDDLDVHFLAPGQVGPLATRTVVVGTQPGRLNLVVELIDTGRDDRLVTVGLAGVGC